MTHLTVKKKNEVYITIHSDEELLFCQKYQGRFGKLIVKLEML